MYTKLKTLKFCFPMYVHMYLYNFAFYFCSQELLLSVNKIRGFKISGYSVF